MYDYTPAGGEIWIPITAEDIEDINLAYSLTGTDAGSFDIDNKGQLSVGSNTDLDIKAKSSYSFNIVAADSAGATDSVAITLDVRRCMGVWCAHVDARRTTEWYGYGLARTDITPALSSDLGKLLPGDTIYFPETEYEIIFLADDQGSGSQDLRMALEPFPNQLKRPYIEDNYALWMVEPTFDTIYQRPFKGNWTLRAATTGDKTSSPAGLKSRM